MNNDLEMYLKEGKLPLCSHCHKRDSVKAALKWWCNDPYLEWLCDDCLDSGEHILTKESVCMHCKKPFRSNIYIADPVIMLCSKKCAKESGELDDLDNYIHITKDSVCPNCKKPFNRDDLYFHDENVYCSKECANEYEGYRDIEYWNECAEKFESTFGKKIQFS